ncbi:TrbI/VirB10 family protein [Rubrivirga litoralis]|uniref:TrbI/VirB10 family protein n=1 Tax=Rubrivirga litoralis TaxID=3075598 RepID=A0ABU3BUH9_9BACT|nr:TrbI/VirB10 family protein [Rubrivirga sp. F394]MDT0632944.1 TrbI/VirB10 family protein [Rubrivirga sp. F394]
MADPTAPLDPRPAPTPVVDDFDSWLSPTAPPDAEPLASAPLPPGLSASRGEEPGETEAFDRGRAFEEGREFARGTTDARYEAVGVNRRLVLGGVLGFVALVLLALMLVTGGDGDERVAADAPVREAAPPEFIDRTPPAPAFADPDPFVYEEPPYQPAPGAGPAPVDPYAPPPYAEPSYPAYSDPYSDPYAARPSERSAAPETAAAPVDPRRERYLKARSSALMVDGGAGALSVGGQSAGASAAGSSAGPFAVRPQTPGAPTEAPGVRTPDQQAAYDALRPDQQAAYDETVLVMRAFGVDPTRAEPAAASAAPPAAPPASAPRPAAVAPPEPSAALAAPPGPVTREEFLRRVQGGAGGAAEPFRVEMPPRETRARRSPLVRRSTDQRGPSAGDAPLFVAPTADGVVPTPPVPAPPALSLLPGTVIPAVLLNGMNSELPGDVIAQVERDVYDSASLRYVLIPKGTRLVGAYDDQVAYGQNRALVAWTTMVFPDGRVVPLPGLPGVDLQGAAGLQDRTDRHLDRVFGAAVALAAVGTGLELATPDNSGDGVDLSPQTVASAQVAIELSRVATQVLRRELDVQPTITVRPGYRLLVFLAREMQFDGPYTAAPDVGRFRRYAPR